MNIHWIFSFLSKHADLRDWKWQKYTNVDSKLFKTVVSTATRSSDFFLRFRVFSRRPSPISVRRFSMPSRTALPFSTAAWPLWILKINLRDMIPRQHNQQVTISCHPFVTTVFLIPTTSFHHLWPIGGHCFSFLFQQCLCNHQECLKHWRLGRL